MALIEKIVGRDMGLEIKAKFTYSLSDPEDFRQITKRNQSPAHFLVEIIISKGREMVVFGDASNHEKLRDGIRMDIGHFDDVTGGQIYLEGEKISKLRLSNLPDYDGRREEKTKLIFNAINPAFLSSPAVLVKYKDQAEAFYEPSSGKLYKAF